MRLTRNIVRVATAGSVVLLIVAIGVLGRSALRQVDSWQWVVHTREVLERVQTVALSITRAESAERAYALSVAPEHARDYERWARQVPRDVREVQELTADNPLQQDRIAVVGQLAAQRLDRMAALVEQRRSGVAVSAAMIEPGLQLMRQLEAQLDDMRSEEGRLLVLRRAQVFDDGRRMLLAVLGLAVLSIVLLGALRWTARRDLVRLEAAHRELKHSAELLEQRVEERTAQLLAANSQLEEFAGTVAHDLRAPLRNIEGFADAIREDEASLSPSGRAYIDRIAAGAGRMDRLILDLLEFSRLGRLEIDLEPVDTRAAAEAAVDSISAEVQQSGARIDVSGNLAPVLGQPLVLCQALANLIGNAIKFVPKGVVSSVAVTSRLEDGWVRIEVRDNGIGVPAAQRERIFGVFERLHTEEEFPGTGIGLAIVRRSVERMGGEVGVHAAEGGGSCFTLSLKPAQLHHPG